MGGLPVERLRDYLRQLPPAARSLLIAEFERALLRGEEILGGDFLLQEVRSAIRDSGAQAQRIGNPARLFFHAAEPFLVDGPATPKQPGRIARAALEPIWRWITRDVLAAEAKTFSEAVAGALVADDRATCQSLTAEFQDRFCARAGQAFAAAAADDKARRKLAAQLGAAKPDDARDLLEILKNRNAFALIAEKLPGHIRNLTDGALDAAKSILDSPLGRSPGLLPYALVVVMGRLAAPWQLIRLAVKAAQSDEAARIAATPYAAAVNIVVADIERMVGELKADLKGGANVAVTSLL
jgi:hypothetical protein